MKWQLWQLISAINLWQLATAKPSPATNRRPNSAAAEHWEHADRTCLAAGKCDTAVSLQHLGKLRQNMKIEADPCDNFHEYACGNWRNEQTSEKTMIRVADEQLTAKYVELFERELNELQEPSNEWQQRDVVMQKMLYYYDVCKRSEATEKLTLGGYFEQLREQGHWRMSDFNWVEMLARLGSYGYSEHFLQMRVEQRNVTYYSITVIPHEARKCVQLNAETLAILQAYEPRRSEAYLRREFGLLEEELDALVDQPQAKCNSTEEDEERDLRVTLSFEQLTQKVPTVNWQLFIGSQLGRIMSPSDLVVVDDLDTIQKLARYLNQSANQRGDVLFLYTLARFLNHLQQQPHSIVRTHASSLNCIRHMRKVLYLPMTYVYEREYYAPVRAESDAVITRIFAQLKAEFSRRLTLNRPQLNAPTLAYLQRKLQAVRLNVGNLPPNVPLQFYIDYVRNLNFSANFYHNHLHALQHTYAQLRFLGALPQPALSSAWHTFHFHVPDFPDSIDATPYYHCLHNMIIIPHAYLQTPFYHHHYWAVLVYGDLATTLGHELIHAFDNKFMEYDAAGNLCEDPVDIELDIYERQQSACLNIDKNFQSERIADITGTQLALSAFMRDPEFLRRNGKLFFLQFAQFFCGAEDSVEAHRNYDPLHDLDSKRLNFTLSHMPEFAVVFNCPAGSAMKAAESCTVW